MNKVILMGRLTRDPEVRYSSGDNQMAIARYSLAVDRRGRREGNDGQTADFINCVAFGRAGEFAESKSASDNAGGFAPADRPSPSSAGDGFMNIPDGIDEELPFN